jgi:hypothetical protein
MMLLLFIASQVMAASVIAGMLWDLYHPEPSPAPRRVPAPRPPAVPLSTIVNNAVVGTLRAVVALADAMECPCEQRANWRCPCGG